MLCTTQQPPASAQHVHEHGLLRLSIAVDGEQLSLSLDVALDTLVGFERVPRTEAERLGANKVMAHLRDPAALFIPDVKARCTPQPVEMEAGLLEPGAKADPLTEHADLQANYRFSCTQPGQLHTLQTSLLEAHPRARRIEVQVAGPRGQRKAVLQRPLRTIHLVW